MAQVTTIDLGTMTILSPLRADEDALTSLTSGRSVQI